MAVRMYRPLLIQLNMFMQYKLYEQPMHRHIRYSRLPGSFKTRISMQVYSLAHGLGGVRGGEVGQAGAWALCGYLR